MPVRLRMQIAELARYRLNCCSSRRTSRTQRSTIRSATARSGDNLDRHLRAERRSMPADGIARRGNPAAGQKGRSGCACGNGDHAPAGKIIRWSIDRSSSVEPHIRAIMLALVAGRVAAEHVGARDLRERHDASAIRRGKRGGGGAITNGTASAVPMPPSLRLSITKKALRASIQFVVPGSSQLGACAISDT